MENVYYEKFGILPSIRIFLLLTNAFSYFLFLHLLDKMLDWESCCRVLQKWKKIG